MELSKEEIIRMAREAGALVFQSSFCGSSFDFNLEQIERFYQLAFAAGAAHERETIMEIVNTIGGDFAVECATAIRARGES